VDTWDREGKQAGVSLCEFPVIVTRCGYYQVIVNQISVCHIAGKDLERVRYCEMQF
jgi:hypothetical protein